MDMALKNWQVDPNSHKILQQREQRKRHLFESEPEVFLSVQLQTKSDLASNSIAQYKKSSQYQADEELKIDVKYGQDVDFKPENRFLEGMLVEQSQNYVKI